jgi:uncharacterized coiled-coil DUF342 family protein
MKTALARKLDQESTDMEPADEKQLLTQVAELRSDVRHVQSDITEIKTRFDKVDKQFEKVDKQFEKVDRQFEKVDQKFEQVYAKLNEITGSIASAKLWAYGLYVGLAGSLLYIIGRSAKWFS